MSINRGRKGAVSVLDSALNVPLSGEEQLDFNIQAFQIL